MEYILANISLPELIQDTTATVISIIIGFFIWAVKQSYDKYRAELVSLKKLELCLSGDLATNKHNQEYLNDWVKTLKLDKLYSCSFRPYYLDNSELVQITNLVLVNKINTLSFQLNTFFEDLKNLYTSYHANSAKLLEKDFVAE